MIIILSILLAIFMCLTLFLGYKCYQFGKTIINVQDSIEQCLDTLDEKFRSMSLILEKPVFFDSIEIRQAIQDIRDSRDAVLYVANSLTNNIQNVSDNGQQDIEEEDKQS